MTLISAHHGDHGSAVNERTRSAQPHVDPVVLLDAFLGGSTRVELRLGVRMEV